MNTHESYTTYDQALILKQLGFDWDTERFYHYDGLRHIITDEPQEIRHECNEEYCCNMPSLAVAARWLREVKGVHIIITPIEEGDMTLYEWDVLILPTAPSGLPTIFCNSQRYLFYEGTLNAALNQILNDLKPCAPIE